MRPRIAITVGDPRGVGPEIVAKVLSDPPVVADYVVIGPDESIRDLPAERVTVGDREAERGKGRSAGGTLPRSPFPLPARDAGLLTALQVEKAVSLAMAQSVDAIVTGPAEKKALHVAGYPYPGHTEWLAVLAGGVETAMMLTTEALRVVLVTTHIALKDVPQALTRERVVRTGRLTRRGLRDWWGISEPRLAVCALNPHASEGGIFGEEDETVLAPAAGELGATGPLPADTVFVRAMNREFDAVLTPYHDVGMTAIKVSGFGQGVNVTLGLPFVRTAPDHGTAFDIAGQGIADASSMSRAVRLACELTLRRLA